MKPPDACYYLSNKAYSFPAPATDDEDQALQPDATPFSCLRTHEPIGPDGEEACDRDCGPHRPCYRPEVQL